MQHVFIHGAFDGLERLKGTLKALRGNHVQVGVFGHKTGRTRGSDVTNAELGLIHEVGSSARNIPARSFLRFPLASHQRADQGHGGGPAGSFP